MVPGLALATSSFGSQFGFAWESPSSAQLAVTLDCSIAQAGWPWAKHRLWQNLACTTQETSGSTHPVDSYRPLSERHHPAPAQLILHVGWRFVVCGPSQSLQLTGLGKSFALICQQQPRLNYKRRVYSVHMECAPQVPSLGDRGSCATGPYRTSTILGYTTKTGTHSSST